MDLSGKKALIADQDANMRRILRVFLEQEDIVVCEAATAVEAQAVLASENPHIIILDLLLDGREGVVLCERIKKDPATRKIVVVFFTEVSAQGDIKAAEQAGADLYLIKPVGLNDILVKIREINPV
ncbi:MAG: hypothetical protein A2268_11045 [Candidatus Raymondbacteria bacterium RifOxyA12_full_50_37]|nr:MAG: hypothetical protein A2268_11045 [Candidatus Raymondbacteria bacterium RifOxyA12_full_50_37]OGJ85547.1 MAG: hypothetical protein A2248_12830 [Candidatus Raymondbacteria bacterium RIFOXYA2_FULL_49_16]OGJ94681.1 MAG: hypothetical protein A2487_08055 [Candidatus Raymondbacteria bacterium RifOxyC12_full_50_8]OGJ95050.1 MAG: hypothetical protein A2453_07530 [Candidatus Raymondbacteria bacterium RIFOXYC2_FULL_50_21]OGK04466.1 MAG: hypothetical protein A2350_05745 [Candidatus Raymondbacteria b